VGSGRLVAVLLLHEMNYEQLDAISTHPLHAGSAVRVRELVTELRRCVHAAQYMQFQDQLYGELRAIQTYRWKCRGAARQAGAR
jgi:hypothetical protein